MIRSTHAASGSAHRTQGTHIAFSHRSGLSENGTKSAWPERNGICSTVPLLCENQIRIMNARK